MADVGVLRCRDSGVICLNRSDHMERRYYAEKESFSYWGAADREGAVRATMQDSIRRRDDFGNFVQGRKWLDIGTGAGGILDFMCGLAAEVAAVEPQMATREFLNGMGYKVYEAIEDAPDGHFDVVTLFHSV